MDQQNKTTKKKTPGNYFEQLLGGSSGRPAKNSVAGPAKSRAFSGDKRLGKGNARGR